MFERRRPAGAERYLVPAEKVVRVTRRHPVVLARALSLWLGSLVVGVAIGFLASPRSSDTLADKLAGWLVLATTAFAVLRVMQWWFSQYVITDRRVLMIEGLVGRKVSAIGLPNVTDITYKRSMLGRLIGYGDVLLDSPGEHPGWSTLERIPDPDAHYRLVTSLVVGRSWSSPEPVSNRRPDEERTGEIPRIL